MAWGASKPKNSWRSFTDSPRDLRSRWMFMPVALRLIVGKTKAFIKQPPCLICTFQIATSRPNYTDEIRSVKRKLYAVWWNLSENPAETKERTQLLHSYCQSPFSQESHFPARCLQTPPGDQHLVPVHSSVSASKNALQQSGRQPQTVIRSYSAFTGRRGMEREESLFPRSLRERKRRKDEHNESPNPDGAVTPPCLITEPLVISLNVGEHRIFRT